MVSFEDQIVYACVSTTVYAVSYMESTVYVDIMVVVQLAVTVISCTLHKICTIIIIGLVSLKTEIWSASKMYRSMLTQ